MGTRGTAPSRVTAIELAQDALIWLAGDSDRIGGFLSLSGIDPSAISARSSDASFLGFVLDHLLADERLLLDFATAQGLPPDHIARARAQLPGGDVPEWT
jgi:hypothetical protein